MVAPPLRLGRAPQATAEEEVSTPVQPCAMPAVDGSAVWRNENPPEVRSANPALRLARAETLVTTPAPDRTGAVSIQRSGGARQLGPCVGTTWAAARLPKGAW